jgi:short-subunit dehydrogenase
MVTHSSKKTVLVTGATVGIGRHVAVDLARRGHRVFATGRNAKALASLEKEASERKLALTTVALDVTSEGSVANALETVRAQTEGYGVDVIVNNAGYGQGGPLLEVDEATLRAQFDTNVFGLMAVTRAFAKDMLGRERGWIVNVSSIGGRITFPFFGAYHASKYALEALSDALRCELRPFGVHLALVEPGPITSQFSERAFGSLPAAQSDSPYAASYSLAPAIRTNSDRFSFGPEHVARAVRKAIGSRWPSARYMAPWFLAIPFAFVPFVPTWLMDAIFRRVFGLGRAPARLLDSGSSEAGASTRSPAAQSVGT